MSDSKETAVIGYIVAVVILATFFWLTLGDAYGRFMIGFDPGKSIMSQYLQPYSRGMTGLVCLTAPMLLAYMLRSVVGRWVDTAWDLSAKAGDWLLVNGKQLAVFSWRHASRAVSKLRKIFPEELNGHKQ